MLLPLDYPVYANKNFKSSSSTGLKTKSFHVPYMHFVKGRDLSLAPEKHDLLFGDLHSFVCR